VTWGMNLNKSTLRPTAVEVLKAEGDEDIHSLSFGSICRQLK